jgi:hypothetical protein
MPIHQISKNLSQLKHQQHQQHQQYQRQQDNKKEIPEEILKTRYPFTLVPLVEASKAFINSAKQAEKESGREETTEEDDREEATVRQEEGD